MCLFYLNKSRSALQGAFLWRMWYFWMWPRFLRGSRCCLDADRDDSPCSWAQLSVCWLQWGLFWGLFPLMFEGWNALCQSLISIRAMKNDWIHFPATPWKPKAGFCVWNIRGWERRGLALISVDVIAVLSADFVHVLVDDLWSIGSVSEWFLCHHNAFLLTSPGRANMEPF